MSMQLVHEEDLAEEDSDYEAPVLIKQ